MNPMTVGPMSAIGVALVLGWSLVLSASVSLAKAAFGPKPSHMGSVLAGFATSDITPPLHLEMAGFGPFLGRKATGIHDPLMAHAMVLEADGKRVAVVDCDVAGITLDLTRKVRTLVELETGIPGQYVLVSTTHTHSGPAIPNWIGWGERNEQYLSDFPKRVAQAVIAASKNLRPMDLYYGEVPVEGVAENREYPGGPIDEKLRLLEFKYGDTVEGFIVNYSVHNVIYSELMHEYTSDLTGVGIAKVLKDYPGAVGVFLQGSCGDINPKPAHGINFASPEKCDQLLEQLSNRFAGYVRQALQGAARMEVTRLQMDTKAIELPEVPTDRALVLRNMQLANELLGGGAQVAFLDSGNKEPPLPESAQRWLRFSRDTSRAVFDRYNRNPLAAKETEIQALRIQDVLILTDPAELFITFADRINEMLPNWKVWVAGYTNDYVGYIPSADRYDLRGEQFSYPAYFTPMMNGEFRFREDVGHVLVQEEVSFARELTAQ
jgi:hypothetical protein